MDAHAFLLDEKETKSVRTVIDRWINAGGKPQDIAKALADMEEFPHVRLWCMEMRKIMGRA